MKHRINIALFFLLLSTLSFACKHSKQTVIQSISNSDLIFKGRLIHKILDTNNRHYEHYFIVSKILKGKYSSKDTILIKSGLGDGDCGVLFQINKEYLIFSKKNYTHNCLYPSYPENLNIKEKLDKITWVNNKK